MASLNTYSPVSNDIHICGRCRAEFNDVYAFIGHKKQCSIKKHQDDVNSKTIQERSTSSSHIARCDNDINVGSHITPSKYESLSLNQSGRILPLSKAGQSIYGEEKHVYIYPSNQETNIALNLCYESVDQHGVNNFSQYQTTTESNCRDVPGQDMPTRLEYCHREVNAIDQQCSAHKISNLDDSTAAKQPVDATVTSQEFLNCSASIGGISTISDNTVDSSALCPEDLEVGQISEAMMGKLNQKFQPGRLGMSNRKSNDSSDKRVGRLDPISTFTLKRKSDKGSTNANKNIARSVPFNANRVDSLSAPLKANCEDEFPVDDMNLKGVTFEKRERLQGVSDDLLNQSPTTSTSAQQTGSANASRSIQFQNNLGSLSADHKLYSTDNPPKQHSVYKAVFTSPSCGGHRLSVTAPDPENELETVKHSQPLSGSLGYRNQGISGISLEEKNCSTSYKNISKLTESSEVHAENVMSNTIEFERSGSLILGPTFPHGEAKITKIECFEGPVHEEIVKEYSFIAQNGNYTNTKTSEQSDSSSFDSSGGGINSVSSSRSYEASSALRADNSINGIILKTNASSTRNPGSFFTTEYNSWEAEEIQVIAASEPMKYMHLSGAGNENKEFAVSLPSENENTKVDGDDTMIYVYKREDGSLIMMCKPDEKPILESGGNHFERTWQTLIETVDNGAAAMAIANEQHPPVITVTQPQLQVDPEYNKIGHNTDQVKITHRKAKQKSVRKIAIKPPNVADAVHNAIAESSAGDVKKSVKGSGSSKVFTCHYGNCSYSTKLEKDFQRHYRTHTGERPFKCDRCDKTFNRTDKLKNHLRCHEGQKPFKCTLCKYATTDNGSLKKHMRIHTDERPFQCQICPYASRNSSQLIVHLRTHTGDAPFHCTQCSAQFKINSDLKRHLRTHTGEKPFACDKCDYRSSNRGNLKSHYKINHSLENEKQCPQCSFVTSSLKRLREHIKIHDEARIIKCSVCQYTCNSSTALRSHMMVHNTLRPFRCTFCPYSSKQSGNLKKHVQNVHNDKYRQTGLISSKSSRQSMKHSLTSSPDKSQHGSGSSSLKRRQHRARDDSGNANAKPDHHQRSSRRTSSSRKIHVCPVCGCGFVRHDSLRCHLKQHGEKEIPNKGNTKVTTSTGGLTSAVKKNTMNTTMDEQNPSVSSSISVTAPPTQPRPTKLPRLQHSLPAPLQQQPQPLPQEEPQQHLQQQQQQPQPIPPFQNPSQPQFPSSLQPLSQTPYRNKGLDSIVAAASQLYREQYMNGKDDDDDGDNDDLNGTTSTSVTSVSIAYSTNTNTHLDRSESFGISENNFRHYQPSQSSCVGPRRFECVALPTSVPIHPIDSAPQPQNNQGVTMKRKREDLGVSSGNELQMDKQPASKKTRSRKRSSASKDFKQQKQQDSSHRRQTLVADSNISNGQVPWEHSSYTASTPKTTNTHTHAQQAGIDQLPPSTLSLLSSSTVSTSSSSKSSSKVIKSPGQSKPRASSSSSSTSSSLLQGQVIQQLRINNDDNNDNNSSSQMYVQSILPQNQHTATTYRYVEASPSSTDASLQPQPISIQLVPPVLHPQASSQSQQSVVGNVSFPQQQSFGAPRQQAATALQILLPAGTQMTQIIQQAPSQQQPAVPVVAQLPPAPPSIAVAVAGGGGGGSGVTLQQQTQQQIMAAQPQIVFQVQEAQTVSGQRQVQDLVTIPASMATQQVLLGQCPPSYDLAQSQVISSPADSTTTIGVEGGVYRVTTEHTECNNDPQTGFHSPSAVTSQKEPPVT